MHHVCPTIWAGEKKERRERDKKRKTFFCDSLWFFPCVYIGVIRTWIVFFQGPSLEILDHMTKHYLDESSKR